MFSKYFQMLVVNSRWMFSTHFKIYYPTAELLKPATYCLIPSGFFTPFYVKGEIMQKNLKASSFLCSWLGTYNVQNQILKEVIES